MVFKIRIRLRLDNFYSRPLTAAKWVAVSASAMNNKVDYLDTEQWSLRFRRISWGKWTLWTAKDILYRGTKLHWKGDEDDWVPGWRGHGSSWEIIGCWHMMCGARPLIGQHSLSSPLIGREWVRHGGPGVRDTDPACSDARHWIMRRNSGQSSAGPGHCDTELLRVRKIRVLCFSLQKRTTKIGPKTAGCQSRLTRALVNHWARIIWNNCNLTALWCTPFRSLATHFKVG